MRLTPVCKYHSVLNFFKVIGMGWKSPEISGIHRLFSPDWIQRHVGILGCFFCCLMSSIVINCQGICDVLCSLWLIFFYKKRPDLPGFTRIAGFDPLRSPSPGAGRARRSARASAADRRARIRRTLPASGSWILASESRPQYVKEHRTPVGARLSRPSNWGHPPLPAALSTINHQPSTINYHQYIYRVENRKNYFHFFCGR